MAPIEDGDYLMPAILDPLSYDKVLVHCKKFNAVEPLLLGFTTTKFVPYGFTNLVAFIIKHKHGVLEWIRVKFQHFSIGIVFHFDTYVFLQCSQ